MPLTNAEKFEHMGRMIWFAVQEVPDGKSATWLSRLFPYAKRYKTEGTSGTQADRAEAMAALRDVVYELQTGFDSTVNAHHMTEHWLPDAEVDNDVS